MITCGPAERNKAPILQVLQTTINSIFRSKVSNEGSSAAIGKDGDKQLRILEVASGTGEHAAFFASEISNIIYQPTEPDVDMHPSINAWCEKELIEGKVFSPLPLNVNMNNEVIEAMLPSDFHEVYGIICINMIHISPWKNTDDLFRIASQYLALNGFLLTYGPYKDNGNMVESNKEFDASLKARNSEWGIRDLTDVREVANNHGFDIDEMVNMPANNLCLIFRRCL
eukprot:gene13842-18565_t